MFFSAYQAVGEEGAARRDGLGSGRAVGLQANRAHAISAPSRAALARSLITQIAKQVLKMTHR